MNVSRKWSLSNAEHGPISVDGMKTRVSQALCYVRVTFDQQLLLDRNREHYPTNESRS